MLGYMEGCWSSVGAALRRLFTHPYGACVTEGCDRPARRWVGYCDPCFDERIQEAAIELAEVRAFRKEQDPR